MALQGKKARNYGIDLLRMVSMYMVVILHVVGHGGIISASTAFTGSYEASWFLKIAALCAVNCFALISGYVGYTSKFKYTSIVMLWLRVAFYTILITIICAIVVPDSVGFLAWKGAIFPVMTGQYWYFTAYFCMSFFIPLINSAIEKLTKAQLRATIIAFVIFFSALPVVFGYDVLRTGKGYDAIWLVILYIIGAYMSKYDAFEKLSATKAVAGYFAVIIITWLAKYGAELINDTIPKEYKAGGLLVSYISPTILGAAVFLLIFFKRLKIGTLGEKIIKTFSPLAFSVYIIHNNPLIVKLLIKNRFASFTNLPLPLLVLVVLGTALGIYIVCSIIDLLREYLFKKTKLKEHLAKIEKKYVKDTWV